MLDSIALLDTYPNHTDFVPPPPLDLISPDFDILQAIRMLT
jgi:hypothetical protein